MQSFIMHEPEYRKVILTEVRSGGLIRARELLDLTAASSDAAQQTNLATRAFGVSQTLYAERKCLVVEAAAVPCQTH